MRTWQNRIIGEGEADPREIVDNPQNWRRHPELQGAALEEALGRLGWIQRVVVNRRTGRLIDGHLRVELARRRGEEAVPVLYVDLDEEEERLALATLDPLSALAEPDTEQLLELLSEIDDVPPALEEMLAELAASREVEGLEDLTTPSRPEDRPSLEERFVVPPFSVLDARRGYWQERKRRWIDLGIRGEVGREGMRGVGSSLSNTVPNYYYLKTAVEQRIGREISNAEFEERYLPSLLPEDSVLARTEDGGILSVFDPVLTEIMYRWFAPEGGRILDPFAGGSVRGIVAALLGYRYVGIELREEQVEANREQAREILPKDAPTPEWIVGDSREILPTLERESFDLVFSCPPYADLEVYSDDPRDLSTMDYEAFLEAYREIIRSSVALLAEDRFAAFVVGEVRDRRGFYRGLVPATVEAFEAAGARLYNEAVYVTPVGSFAMRAGRMMARGRKLSKTHQNVLVFYKGDPRRIVEELGELDLSGVDWGVEEGDEVADAE